ncbi:hypothetical protein [Brachyspira alvinipulli]|uniref:hypothetical protein n=1 Tax=Brachyspira alvinipulli TaxID=84379 RepID=UPI000481C05A|nr:hypothetical protein [Brachyspira alvinipulli]
MKRIIASIFFVFMFSSVMFAQHGGGVALFVPLTGSFAFADIRGFDGNKIDILKSGSAFDFGVLVQPGYFYDFGGLLGFDALADIGYYRSSYNYRNSTDGSLVSYTFDTVNVGAMFRVTVLVLSLGIGSGVKIPLAANIKDGDYSAKLNSDDIKNSFTTAVIPYLKFTIDFKYNLSSFAAVAAGLYFNYDFGMNYKNPNYSRYNIHSFDFGIQLGTYLVGTKN